MDICEHLDKVYDYLEKAEIPLYEKMMMAVEITSAAGFSIAQTNAFVKRVTNKSIDDFVNSDEYSDEFKWSNEMGVDGLVQILEQGATPKEAFDFVMTKYEKTPEWVDEVKHKKIRNTGKIIQEVEKIATQRVKKLKKQKVYDKTSLVKATTPNSQFNKAHKLITISDRLDDMEQRMSEYERIVVQQQLVLETMNQRLNHAEQNISVTSNKVDNMELSITRDKIQHMKDAGMSLPEISTSLDIPLRRVKYLLYQK